MREFGDETGERPAPLVMAAVAMLAIVIGYISGFVVFYGLAGYLWIVSLQIVIWRAVKASKES